MIQRLCILSLILAVLLGVFNMSAQAQDNDKKRNIPSVLNIPRFVSVGSDKAFVRTGPAMRYPIKWVFNKKGVPVEIIQEFDSWRRIRDVDGEEGWVHRSLLSGRRYVIVKSNSPASLFIKPDPLGRIAAVLEPYVIAKAKYCNDAWCQVSVSDYEGWLQKNLIWGIYADEVLD